MSTYKDAGVDIEAGDAVVEGIKKMARLTHGKEVLQGVGGFSGLYRLENNLVLSAGADGVGTKILVAQKLGIHDTVGIDLVAMNVDDVVTSGARPLFFLDYIAVGKDCLKSGIVLDIVKGVAEGCRQAGCALLGGETAEMNDLYGDREYDLAGFCVGMVEEDEIIDGWSIKKGDAVLGIASSGLHSNGYSLVRSVMKDYEMDKYFSELGRTLGEELLEPTMIYAPHILSLKEEVNIKGASHITGGGILSNTRRILPVGLDVNLSWNWEVPRIFSLIQKTGKVSEEEMRSVFNLGIGMILVVDPEDADKACTFLEKAGLKARVIGEVAEA